MLSEPMLEGIFSPLQMQIKEETYSSTGDGVIGNNANFGHPDVQFQFQQDSTEADTFISQFLDSVLNSSGDIEFQNHQDLGNNLGRDMQDRKEVNLSSF